MTELFAALTAVITEHGLGDAGWKSARWEVCDTVRDFIYLFERQLTIAFATVLEMLPGTGIQRR
jgi:hypothetical protein